MVLLALGWISVCGASYTLGTDTELWDFSTRAGKQLVWIVCSFGLAFVLMMIDEDLYDTLAYFIYVALLLILVVTIFIAPDTRGSRSWLDFGVLKIQPAEFAKFATALCLAKFMGSYGFVLNNWKNALTVAAIIVVPMLIIVKQKETGSALVYFAFLLMLYREGMPGIVLYSMICAALYFVVGIKFGEVPVEGLTESVGQFAVLLMILLFTSGLVLNYTKNRIAAGVILGGTIGGLGIAWGIAAYVVSFDLIWAELGLCTLAVMYLLILSVWENRKAYALITVFSLGSVAFLYSCDYLFDKVLQPHQQTRIKVALDMEKDIMGDGYNVNQSIIAIGSGGLTGKGFLNGTQSQLKYVPEQETDFIFCTMGEEQGFVGSCLTLLLYLCLILRLLFVAERQSTSFGRIYGYCVFGIFFFHLFINIGMVLGLTPVIGVPLPLFSYGGSSLWGFTILLFIFLRIDANRKRHPQ